MTPATSHPPDLDLALAGVTVLDPAGPVPCLRDAVIGVRDGAIVSVGTDRSAIGAARRVCELPGRVVTPGFVNVHTHCALAMVRGVAADLGFAPSYTPGIPQGADLNPDEARALARLAAPEALLFGNLVHNSQGRDLEMVLVDGGRPTRVALEEVVADAERAARRLWAAAGRPW